MHPQNPPSRSLYLLAPGRTSRTCWWCAPAPTLRRLQRCLGWRASTKEGGLWSTSTGPWSNPTATPFIELISMLLTFSISWAWVAFPNTVADTWKTKECLNKFFLYTLALCETNAFRAYAHFTNKLELTRAEWKEQLGTVLINYGLIRMKKRPADAGSGGEDTLQPLRRSPRVTRNPSSGSHSGSGSVQLFGTPATRGSTELPPAITPERWKKKGEQQLPIIFTSSSTLAVAEGQKHASPASKINPSQKHQGPRGSCTICKTLVRSVCSCCLTPLCPSTVGRNCFKTHVVQHLKAWGFKRV